MTKSKNSGAFKGHRFPLKVIAYAVWAYFRFGLSLRDVEDLLMTRGIIVSYETVRKWVAKFGTKRLPPFVGRISDVLFKVLKYDVFGDCTVGGLKGPVPPKPPAPVALFEMLEFALHFVGRSALHQPHQITDRQFRRDGHEHVDMVARQNTPDDLHPVLSTNLTANLTYPQLDIALQHFGAILRAKALPSERRGV